MTALRGFKSFKTSKETTHRRDTENAEAGKFEIRNSNPQFYFVLFVVKSPSPKPSVNSAVVRKNPQDFLDCLLTSDITMYNILHHGIPYQSTGH